MSVGGYVPPSLGQPAATTTAEADVPIFNIERVALQFPRPSDFVAAQVANNAIILAFATGRILRIDLDDAGDIEDIDLPKKTSEVGTIRRMFLDPTASHLLITTSTADNFYLHSQSKTPKHLPRLKGVSIESVAWNPSQPTASTREILLGAADGRVYETYIEPSPEFYRSPEKYAKKVHVVDGAVVGIWVDVLGQSGTWRVLMATPHRLLHWVGKMAQKVHDGSGPAFERLFKAESPVVHDSTQSATPSCLAVSPWEVERGTVEPALAASQSFAWLSSSGVFHGALRKAPPSQDLGRMLFSDAKLLARSQLPPSLSPSGRRKVTQESAASMILSRWHVLQLIEGRVVATNILDDAALVLDQQVLEPGQTALGLYADVTKGTFWLVTADEIFEIAAHDESRDVWKILLASQQFEAASLFARTAGQKDAVATASGDYLIGKKQFMEAAAVYGRSTKPFEEVALAFIDNNERDALRKYLLTKLTGLEKAAIMQRTMVASWLVELFMAKLNELDDTITSSALGTNKAEDLLAQIRREFREFVTKHKSDLHVKTTYEIISGHGREEELLYFAIAVDDYKYVLSYWVQRERWKESLDVLKKQTDAQIFYRYASVLMSHVAPELVDILMRQSNLEPQRLIPALLNYNAVVSKQDPQPQPNQAIRYLNFVINKLGSADPAVHNALVSILAAAPGLDETSLLAYLRSQSFGPTSTPSYDSDFALRLCIQHSRVRSCVHIYSSMSQYTRAVRLALSHGAVDLASSVADQCTGDPGLRKRLWLDIAKEVIRHSPGNIKTAIDLIHRCELLRIVDLIPLFPDFVVIDDFKDEICAALKDYSQSIDALKAEMDTAAITAKDIKAEIRDLDTRFAIVDPGEKCWICRLPLLVKQFFVFPCQHAFHSECLGKRVVELGPPGTARRIREWQSKGRAGEVDELVGRACVLCSDMAVKQIDEPFVAPNEGLDEWAL